MAPGSEHSSASGIQLTLGQGATASYAMGTMLMLLSMDYQVYLVTGHETCSQLDPQIIIVVAL